MSGQEEFTLRRDRMIRLSGDDIFPDAAVDVGEAQVAAAVLEGELFVIDAEQVEHGGPELVDIRNLFDGVIAELVSGSIDVAALAPTSSHPEAEALRIVVAADVLREVRLREGVTSKLTGEND